MSNSIEIFQNTLLKLIVRQGEDSDRKLILLDTGELGYATDTDRLFIGDGSTMGGIAVGNKYIGDGVPTLVGSAAQIGDLVFDPTAKTLYKFKGGVYTDPANWLTVGAIYSAGESLQFQSSNNTISLSSSISVDRITQRSSAYLNLPEKTSLNSVNYNWPIGGLQNNLFLGTDAFGNLSWKTPLPLNTYYVANSASRIPVGMITPFVSGGDIPYGWLLCNGQPVLGATYPVLSAAIGTRYGGSGGSFNLPDFTNRTLYGVVTDPATSTTFRLASGTDIGLSAVGTNFIIKAIPDNIVTSTITVLSSLSATVGGINITGTAVTTLTGNIEIGLAPIISPVEIQTTFNIDQYGRVSSVPVTNAGIIAGTVINPSSYIKFLTTPIKVIDITDNFTFKDNITVFPIIPGIPANAKTVILDSYISNTNNDQYVIVCASYDKSNLHSITGDDVVGTAEYLVSRIRSADYGAGVVANQCMIPLSSNGVTSSFGLRVAAENVWDNGFVRVIGYTL